MTDLLPQIRDSTDKTAGGGGVLLGILGGGVTPDVRNPDPISDHRPECYCLLRHVLTVHSFSMCGIITE